MTSPQDVTQAYDLWMSFCEELDRLWEGYVEVVGFTPYGPQSFTKVTRHYSLDYITLEEVLGGDDNAVNFHLTEVWGEGSSVTHTVLLSELMNQQGWAAVASKKQAELKHQADRQKAQREQEERTLYQALRAKFETPTNNPKGTAT